MASRCTECASSAEQIEGLQELLFDPSAYRSAYRDNVEGDLDGEIFEVLKKEIVEYSKNTPAFKKYLLASLGAVVPDPKGREPSSARSRPATQSYTPRIRSSMIYTPRSSSRPTLD